MKVCFGFFPFATVPYHKIAEELSRRFSESKFSGYVVGNKWYRYLHSTGFPYSRLEVLSDYVASYWDGFKPDLGYLQSMEQEYYRKLSRFVSIVRP